MRVTDKEITIVNRAYETHLLLEIARASGVKVNDISPLTKGSTKTKKVQRIINGCNLLLKEDLEDLKEILDKE